MPWIEALTRDIVGLWHFSATKHEKCDGLLDTIIGKGIGRKCTKEFHECWILIRFD